MNGSGLLNTTTAASATIAAPARTRSVALGGRAGNVCQPRFRGSNPSFCQGQGITGSSSAYGTSNEVLGQTTSAGALIARRRGPLAGTSHAPDPSFGSLSVFAGPDLVP